MEEYMDMNMKHGVKAEGDIYIISTNIVKKEDEVDITTNGIPSIDTCNLIISNVRTPPTHFPTRVFANINKSIDIDKVSTPATHIQTRIVPDAKTVLEEIERLSAKKRTVRYPGDIDVSVDMSPEKARQNLLLCQSKIKAQAKEIYRLKQKTKRQRDQIKRLKGMVRGNSDNPGMEGSQSSNDNSNHSPIILSD